MKLLALAGVLVLAGCATQEQRAENLMTRYGPFCEKLGYEKNTDGWRGCIVSQGNARSTYVPKPSMTCRTVGDTTTCN